MKLLRILIEGWTASFRYPAFISGFQPTLPVPPLSTIYGLLSAVKGELVTPNETNVGFVFDYDSKSVDLETIYVKNADANYSTPADLRQMYNDFKAYVGREDTDTKLL